MRVLVVDDSAVVRQTMVAILGRERDIDVDIAADPLFAMAKLRRARPDVIVLDVEMPRMDGITFLRRLSADRDPIPVVICSALTGPGSDLALRALDEGAIEIIPKPRASVSDFLRDSAVMVVDAVRGAAASRRRRRARPAAQDVSPLPAHPLRVTTDKIIAVGASTGGTEALAFLLSSLPPDSPGLVVVQHMPEAFTAAFARRLDAISNIEVKEAADGDRVLEGRALIAPGNRHTRICRSGAHYIVEVRDGPLVSRHRPSVDVLFWSAAEAARANAIGVIMTGMGDDGADGLLQMHRAGAVTIAQDEQSCVVFGMPKEAIQRGAVDHVAPLERIPRLLYQCLTGERRR